MLTDFAFKIKKNRLTGIFDKDLVEELPVLGGMDVDVILQLLESVAHNVDLVRGHHNVLDRRQFHNL